MDGLGDVDSRRPTRGGGYEPWELGGRVRSVVAGLFRVWTSVGCFERPLDRKSVV